MNKKEVEMKKQIMTILALLFSSVAQKMRFNREVYGEITNLKIRLFYLKVIKSSRLLFLGYCVIGFCLVLLFSSLLLFHATFFLYVPCGIGTKMLVGFLSAGCYLILAVKLFTVFLSESQWIDIFHAQGLYKDLNGAVRPHTVKTK
jgi:hypothetical protein